MTTSEQSGTDTPTSEKSLLGDGGALRCSTSERERIGAMVQEAAGEGRLDLEEATERLDRVYAARYRHELDAVVADLPGSEDDPTRWSAIATVAHRRLIEDVTRLIGASGDGSRTRLVIAGLLALLIGGLLIVAMLHGIVSEGPDYGEGFR